VLSIIPIIITNIRQASSNAQYFASVSEAALFVAAVKPFYFNGFWEELYFRGLLLSLLLTRLRVGLAVAVSAVIFALSHYDLIKAAAIIDFHQFLTQLFVVFVLGLVTASVCWRSGSLWPAILFHSCSSGLVYLTALIARNW
jgi:membrane protease YdiL (CAAX protease family)